MSPWGRAMMGRQPPAGGEPLAIVGRLALDVFGPPWGLILFAGGIFFVPMVPAFAIAAFRATRRVVFKVFLGDARNLQGLYRFASFLGLGLTLLALGCRYQRMLNRAEG